MSERALHFMVCLCILGLQTIRQAIQETVVRLHSRETRTQRLFLMEPSITSTAHNTTALFWLFLAFGEVSRNLKRPLSVLSLRMLEY
jgi:hypothetical protein